MHSMPQWPSSGSSSTSRFSTAWTKPVPTSSIPPCLRSIRKDVPSDLCLSTRREHTQAPEKRRCVPLRGIRSSGSAMCLRVRTPRDAAGTGQSPSFAGGRNGHGPAIDRGLRCALQIALLYHRRPDRMAASLLTLNGNMGYAKSNCAAHKS